MELIIQKYKEYRQFLIILAYLVTFFCFLFDNCNFFVNLRTDIFKLLTKKEMVMKKLNLVLFAAMSLFAAPLNGQTILSEDFETSSTETYSPNFNAGWTTEDNYLGNENKFRWHIYYASKGSIGGTHCASCDGAMFENSADGTGPREEVLMSPELTLDDAYQLSFNWKGASASALEKKEYDLQVRIVEGGDLKNAVTVWSFQDPEALKESGVPEFPWKGWTVYNSKIGLEKFQGKKVKIAFVYKMLKKIGNSVYVDDVKVSKYTPMTSPVATLSKKLYNFGDVYMGEKVWSEVITLKNAGTSGLTISDIELPNGFDTNLDKTKVNLGKNETVDFQISYNSSLTSSTDGKVVIKTNGGDATIRVIANKVALPEGATFEGFEKGCPPVGWTAKSWSATNYALEGDLSAYASAILDGACELKTTRLDLSQGNHSVSFTCFNNFESDVEGAAPANDVTLQLSKDGGATWTTVWTSSLINGIDHANVDLGAPASDNCYLKWVYSAITFDEEYVPETSIFFLDRVVLPKMFGTEDKPAAAKCLTPADNAVNVFNSNVLLSWERVLFAKGYKLYVGTDAEATNVVNGKDLGDVTEYTIEKCNYATKYYWKVVPYNDNGDSEKVETWTFTTMADQTVSTYPYKESFEGENFPPLGWNYTTDQGTRWDFSTTNAFDGKVSAVASCREQETTTTLNTNEFKLPAEPVEISFYWGNDMPIALEKDNTGLVENTSKADDGLDACFFEILVDNQWKQLAIISDKNNKFWCREVISLKDYAGKTVSFRWRYVAHSYMQASGVCLDMIVIQPSTEVKASFNVSKWDAGKVNYNKVVTSRKPLTIINDGSKAIKVAKVEFGTENFTSTLAENTVIEPRKASQFSITFSAKASASIVEDAMKVTFDNGAVLELPVVGEALANDIAYYDFENEEPGTLTPKDFTTVDVDRKPTTAMTTLDYPMRGVPFAFCVQTDKDWNNVFEPVSGENVLVAIAPGDDSESNDWIISKQMTATSDSRFKFYARNWNSVNSILPETPHSVEVLVSTTDTQLKSFEVAMSKVQMPYYGGKYEFFDVDLSKYAGQKIYIAVHHTVTSGLAAFFDDFTFEHFEDVSGGVEALGVKTGVSIYPNPAVDVVTVSGAESADVVIANLSGAVVLSQTGVKTVNVSDLSAGVYVMTVRTESGVFTTKLLKK